MFEFCLSRFHRTKAKLEIEPICSVCLFPKRLIKKYLNQELLPDRSRSGRSSNFLFKIHVRSNWIGNELIGLQPWRRYFTLLECCHLKDTPGQVQYGQVPDSNVGIFGK